MSSNFSFDGQAANWVEALYQTSEAIDAQATTRHDQLEPALGIGEDSKVLQRISLDDEQIGKSSGSHHAHLSLHPQ